MDTITLIPNNSLLTATPEEGRQLAIKMARLIIKATQPDEQKRQQLRDVYANDAMMLSLSDKLLPPNSLPLQPLTTTGDERPTCDRTYLDGLMSSRRYVKVQYFTELHELITLNALIAGLGTEGDDSVVSLSSGARIPLTRLVSAGGHFSPGYDGYAPYCETCDC